MKFEKKNHQIEPYSGSKTKINHLKIKLFILIKKLLLGTDNFSSINLITCQFTTYNILNDKAD